MKITWHISRKNPIWVICFIILAIFIMGGCKKNMVKHDQFAEKPFAVQKGDVMEVHFGDTRESGNRIKALAKIEGYVIYVSGEFTSKKIPQILSIKLPDLKKSYLVYWIDGDGNMTEIAVR